MKAQWEGALLLLLAYGSLSAEEVKVDLYVRDCKLKEDETTAFVVEIRNVSKTNLTMWPVIWAKYRVGNVVSDLSGIDLTGHRDEDVDLVLLVDSASTYELDLNRPGIVLSEEKIALKPDETRLIKAIVYAGAFDPGTKEIRIQAFRAKRLLAESKVIEVRVIPAEEKKRDEGKKLQEPTEEKK